MPRLKLASFNVKNLAEPGQDFYRFQRYTPEEFSWKIDWVAQQILSLNADVLCLQEVFDPSALDTLMARVETESHASNALHVPGTEKRYHRKAIFDRLALDGYAAGDVFFAPNALDGPPGSRRPGLAIVSRNGFVDAPEVIQRLADPVMLRFGGFADRDGGQYRMSCLSRPIIKARVRSGPHVISVFNCHLKSKLPEFPELDTDVPAPEANLLAYDSAARALGQARATMRRMAEAWALRREILRELEAGFPVIVAGDLNDADNAVSSQIIEGETPFKNYTWMLRHDARNASDRYTQAEDTQIQAVIRSVKLHSAERLFVRKSARDMVYTSAFGGHFESIDQILLSHHFLQDAPGAIGQMTYFSVLNDHLTDGSHPEAPYNKLASDHGQIMVHLDLDRVKAHDG